MAPKRFRKGPMLDL